MPTLSAPLAAGATASSAATTSSPSNTTTEFVLYDAGIASLAELHDLPSMGRLRTLNLHCNRIARISHLEPLVNLTYLNLSSNRIDAMSGLHTLQQLQTLDLSCNLIRMIDGLATLGALRKLQLSYNRISSLAGLVQCHGGALQHVELYGNQLGLLREVRPPSRAAEPFPRAPLHRTPAQGAHCPAPHSRALFAARIPPGAARAHGAGAAPPRPG